MHEASVIQNCTFTVVGIGASAGGLQAASDLLKDIPARSGMAFVLVQHMDPSHPSGLAELLSGRTELRVVEAVEGVAVQPDHVYVIPPNTRMTIRECRLLLTPRASGRAAHLPIDHFFCSLAEDLKSRAVGVVLSGSGSDGTIGLEAIKSEGGITFAQDKSAAYGSMPREAAAAGVVDLILDPGKIAVELAALNGLLDGGAEKTEAVFSDRAALDGILALLREDCGVDFAHYKANTVQRRLARRLALSRVNTLADYLKVVRQDKQELALLFDDLLITVTEFFRDPDAFEFLSSNALPPMLENRDSSDPIRVWVVGCSTGKEAYSIAITLSEVLEKRGASNPVQIFGTDISDRAIETARGGKFPENISATLSPERLAKYFVRVEGGYRIGRSIREMCTFSRHDVTRDTPLARMDLISCRNLLIYFGPVLQRRVLQVFAYSLKPGACLMLGQSEAVASLSTVFQPLDLKSKIYCRDRATVSPSLYDLSFMPVRVLRSGAPRPPEEPETAQHVAERMLIEEYAPPSLVIDSRREVLRFAGNVGPFLIAANEYTGLDLMSMIQPRIFEPLRKALDAAINGAVIAREPFAPEEGNEAEVVVRPMGPPRGKEHFLVTFETTIHRLRRLAAQKRDGAGRSAEDIALDLAATRAYMQRLVEELRSANEEAQSSNEELQSTNEELQTAKEELQSSNEELITTNEEMQFRNAELHRVNTDLLNLLSSLQVPILMLDRGLRICRYTPLAERIFNLIPTDVGRPVSDLGAEIDIPRITASLNQVIASGVADEQEVRDAQGRWFSVRLQPFRNVEGRIDGVVLQLLDIDDLKQTIASLGKARAYADTIVEAVRDALVVLDADYRVQSVNKSFCQMFGCTPEEPLRKSIFELDAERWNLPRVRELLARVEREQTQDEIELEDFREHDEHTFLLSARRVASAPGDLSILLAIEDISDRKRAAEAKYRRLFESAKDGILMLDATEGVVTDANPFGLEVLSKRRDDVVGMPFWESIPLPGGPEEGRRLLEELNRREQVRLRDLEIRDGSHARTVEIIGNAYLEQRRPVVQLNIRDITERQQFERQLQQTAKLESLGVLAGGIAHDFNNLLTGVMGNASLALLEANPTSRYQTALRDVVKASHRAAELTSQMLAYAGKGRYVVRPLNLSELVKEIGALIRSSLPKFIAVDVELAQRLPNVDADSSQLQQVIMNLVINAAESMEAHGGGTVRVKTSVEAFDPAITKPKIAAEGLKAGRFVVLEVSDTGEGMDEGTLDRIFDPFYTTKFTGRGLGLAAVHGIVRGHDGALSVDTRPGKGSTFRLYLPPSIQTLEEAPEEIAAAESLSGAGTVLIVDDEPDLIKMVRSVLEFYGYTVLVAGNGVEALQIVEERGAELFAVVMDIHMPQMNGEEAVKHMARLRPELPVILSTGYDSSEIEARLAPVSIAGVLQKPYTAQTFLRLLKEKVDRWPQ